MDNLRNSIEVLFRRVDPGVVLNDYAAWGRFLSEEEGGFIKERSSFKEKFLSLSPSFSGNQVDCLLEILKGKWFCDDRGHYSAFRILPEFGRQVLRLRDDQPICQYEHYLRWNELSSSIGEDILTCSYLAECDLQRSDLRRDFAWDVVLRSDNTQLDALFRRGLSELHCHLNGSSINFDLNWLAIMNEPTYQNPALFQQEGSNWPFYDYAMLAAFLRLVLYLEINNRTASAMFQRAKNLLDNMGDRLSSISLVLPSLQAEISAQASAYGYKFDGFVVDYAIPSNLSENDRQKLAGRFLVGERALMYQCFQYVYSSRQDLPELPIVFYLYLLIKGRVKDLIVQHNGVKGFANFKFFDSNKERFVEFARGKAYKTLVPAVALQTYFTNPNIDYFEFRLAPKNSTVLLKRKMDACSRILARKHLHCVLHFIKTSDERECFDNSLRNSMVCRNEKARRLYLRQAEAIGRLLWYNDSRIVGIDAANSEFGCRPEVFGPVFRRLQHPIRNHSLAFVEKITNRDLGITYHVGEDYYDIVDGLRAINEAVLFLGLRDGARLGHAVALGIDPLQYYFERHNKIIIPKQDLLDNIMWLLSKMDEYTIPDSRGVRCFLLREFQRLISELYPTYAYEGYETYYQSWLLRGDDPYLYQNISDISDAPQESLFRQYCLNAGDLVATARRNSHARVLFREYHFNASSKQAGHIPEEMELPGDLLPVIASIQKEMREMVAKKKIAIEVNPTSNLRICNINSYDTHPVLKFRNYGLSVMDEYNDCPQISVSINTDDSGIFATSLEKEYTLMALALEKQKTRDGASKFQANNILAWLEGIRQQSEAQRFWKEDVKQ